jgi:hypothetical protein
MSIDLNLSGSFQKLSFVKLMPTEKGNKTDYFFQSLFCFRIRDPGSEIQNPRFEIRDSGWKKIRIRNKYT